MTIDELKVKLAEHNIPEEDITKYLSDLTLPPAQPTIEKEVYTELLSESQKQLQEAKEALKIAQKENLRSAVLNQTVSQAPKMSFLDCLKTESYYPNRKKESV